ncbi:efflux RND transporter periplasmic adaptor subunit [Paraburkholderia strydomiana]|uniref:efflux RND transporter periplasmic adaptor subunit n=1 Tax=Paraburkholderia strydomiana TaxID=1245417 RepID=UPI0038B8A56E
MNVENFKTRSSRIALGAGAVAVVVGIATLTIVGVDAQSAESPAAPPLVEVNVASVLNRSVVDWQQYSGRLEAIDRVQVRPQVSGKIVAVNFKDGAMVKKGDTLFIIDPRPYQAAVDGAAASLAAAKARVAYTSADWTRAQRLLNDNAIAKRDYDEKQNASLEASANVKAAQAALETAQINLEYTKVIAPVSGKASRAEITLGNVVSSGPSAPALTTVVSISPIYAAFDADEQTYLDYIGRIRSGKPTPVALGLANEGGYSRQGVIDSVDNQLDTTSGTIRIRARFDNSDGTLVPGLYARIKVSGSLPHQALLIDAAALSTDQDKKFVLVVDRTGHANYRQVKLGTEQGNLRVITSGLNSGEQIVVSGLQRVRPGDRVRPRIVPMDASNGSLSVTTPGVTGPMSSGIQKSSSDKQAATS